MTGLLRRILTEKRAAVVPIVIALLANVFVYAAVVRPRAARAEGAADRAAQAAESRRAAEREAAAAGALVEGKTRAAEELDSFYQKVVSPDLEAAQHLTYVNLPMLAQISRVLWQTRTSEVVPPERGARLGHLVTHMVLQGNYQDLRQFIYQVESAPQFIIIDDVSLTEAKANEPLTLTIRVSTYYRRGTSS